MVEHHDVAEVCLRGHVTTGGIHELSQYRRKHCPKCGEPTITECRECAAELIGNPVDMLGFVTDSGESYIYDFCHNCGKPYPWTETRQHALYEAIEELSSTLNEEEIDKLKASVPDVIASTEKSDIAVARFKRIKERVGGPLGTMVINVLSNVATEYVKEQLGLKGNNPG